MKTELLVGYANDARNPSGTNGRASVYLIHGRGRDERGMALEPLIRIDVPAWSAKFEYLISTFAASDDDFAVISPSDDVSVLWLISGFDRKSLERCALSLIPESEGAVKPTWVPSDSMVPF